MSRHDLELWLSELIVLRQQLESKHNLYANKHWTDVTRTIGLVLNILNSDDVGDNNLPNMVD